MPAEDRLISSSMLAEDEASEFSLAGEIRPVGRIKQRAKTALNLGYKTVLAPETEDGVITVNNIKNLIKEIF